MGRLDRHGRGVSASVAAVAAAAVLGFAAGPSVEGLLAPALRWASHRVSPPGLRVLARPTAEPRVFGQLVEWALDQAARAALPAGIRRVQKPADGVPARAPAPAQEARIVDGAVPALASVATADGPRDEGDAAGPHESGQRPAVARPLRPPTAGLPARPREGYLVAIYHTHTSEEYRRDDFHPEDPGAYHRFGSSDTGIVRVGRALSQALSELGVPALHVDAVHDYPDYRTAYARSRETARSLAERYPGLRLLLDVHRDAPQEGGYLVTSVNGREVARIAIVVGRGLPGEASSANLAMANQLAQVAEARFPGLMRRVIEVPGRRYNQDVHPGALLVEIGSYRTDEQAGVRAARLFALVIAEALGRLSPGGRPF